MCFLNSAKPEIVKVIKERTGFIFCLLLCLLFRPGTVQAVKVELDAGSSSSASMSVSVSVGSTSDSDVWSSSEIQYNGLVGAQSSSETSYATANASINSSAQGVSPDPGVRYINRSEIYNIQFNQECLANPVPVTASFSTGFNAIATVYWDLLPSTVDEEIGRPVIVGFGPISYGISYSSFNTTYEQQICTWKFGISGGETDGPYEVTLEGVTPEPAWEDIEMHAHIGDKIMLSYEMYNVGGTQDPSTGSSFELPWGVPVMGLSIGVSAMPAIIVPNVVGMAHAEAEETLSAAGLINALDVPISSGAPAGTVVSQDPSAETWVSYLQQGVILYISDGTGGGGGGMPIQLDIKPNNCANRITIPIKAADKIRIPAAIIGSSAIDVWEVDTTSLLLEGIPSLTENVVDKCSGICDIPGPDGFYDLMLTFRAADVIEAIGGVNNGETVTLKLTGKLERDGEVYSFGIEDFATFVFKGPGIKGPIK